MGRRIQKTVNVNGHKITIVITGRTSVGNFVHWSAWVSDNRGNELHIPVIKVLRPTDAQDRAYVKFVKQYAEAA